MRDIVFVAVVIGFFALSFVKAFRAVEVSATGGSWLLTGFAFCAAGT
jgi:hypothetical protein